jgi:hypothetical protein
MSNAMKGLLLVVVATAAISLYLIFDPSDYNWFPKCVFYQMTGLECPACGSQRAVHAILNGSFLEGFLYNPFIVISIPYGFGLVMIMLFKTPFTAKLRSKLLHHYAVYTYCVIFVGWWIIRNLI